MEEVSEHSNFVDWASFWEFRSSEGEAMHSSPTTHQPHQQRCWGSPPATLVRSLCVSQTQKTMLLDAFWCDNAIEQRDVEFDGTNLRSSDRVEISTVAKLKAFGLGMFLKVWDAIALGGDLFVWQADLVYLGLLRNPKLKFSLCFLLPAWDLGCGIASPHRQGIASPLVRISLVPPIDSNFVQLKIALGFIYVV